MAMWNFRDIIKSSYLVRRLYRDFVRAKCRALVFKKVSKLRSSGANCLDRESLLRSIKACPEFDVNKVVHIVASGWSLCRSRDLVDEDSFVIGFNHAAISGLKFDVYFVELGGYENLKLSCQFVEMVEKFVLPSTRNVYFKNLWGRQNDVEFLCDHWKYNCSFVKDELYLCHNSRDLDEVIDRIINPRSKYLPQFNSTVVTAIGVATSLGFKKIVVHGLDFGGDHFFFDNQYSHLGSLLPERTGVYQKSFREEVIHMTAKGEFGIKAILPILREKLLEGGVALYSATSESPSACYLPVYSKEGRD